MTMSLGIQKSYSIGSKTFGEQRSLSGNEAIVREISVPQALAGTVAAAMTSTTSTTTTLPPGGTQSGTLTLSSVSGLAIGNRLDVYWSGGKLYGATIEDIDSVAKQVFFSGGTVWSGGSAFPSNGTAITAMVPTNVDLNFAGSNCQGIVVYSDAIGTAILDTATPAETAVFHIATAATTAAWLTGDGTVNPVTGHTITQLFLSHNDSTGAKTMRVGVLVNP